MLFSVIRTDENGDVPFVNQEADQFSSDRGATNGLWSTLMNSNFYFVTNGVTNPTLKMRPGGVQGWRLLDAASGETLPIILENHELHVLANDGINVPEMITLPVNEPYVMGAENRVLSSPRKRVHPLSYKFPYIFSNELKELCLQTP